MRSAMQLLLPLLLTRQDISDNSSSKIMQLFYQELQNGKRKSEALRLAKLAFLDEADEVVSNPFYWSSYYIFGDDSTVIFGKDRKREWGGLPLFMFVALAALSFLLINRKNTANI